MKRRIPILSTLSLLLLATTIVLWIRSRHHADAAGFYTFSGHLDAMSSDKGGMLFFSSNVPFGQDMGLSGDAMSFPADEFVEIHDMLFDPANAKWSFIGFRFAAGPIGQWGWKYSTLMVPYWALIIVLAILPLSRFRGLIVRRRRRRRGQCLICGYDLSHSEGRCPECGAAIGGSSKAAAGEDSAAAAPSGSATATLSLLLLGALLAAAIGLVVRGRHTAARAAIAPPELAVLSRPFKQIDSYGRSGGGTQHWAESDVVRVGWAAAAPRVVRSYPVADLLVPASVDGIGVGISTGPVVTSGNSAWTSSSYIPTSQALGEVVGDMILADQWVENRGSIGGFAVFAGRLWVWQTQQGHAAVRTLLAAMRSPAGAATSSSPTAVVDPQVDLDQMIPELKLDSTTLEAAIDTLRLTTHSNILVYWSDLEVIGIRRDTPVRLHLWNVSLDRALGAILTVVGGEYPGMRAFQDGVIVVASPEKLRHDPATIHVYDIRDLIAGYCAAHSPPPTRAQRFGMQNPQTQPSAEEAAQEIADLVERFVDSDSWRDNGGTAGSLREFNGLLVVSQSPSAHREIAVFLHKLRAGGVIRGKSGKQ